MVATASMNVNLFVEDPAFYRWLVKHTKYITDYPTLLSTYKMFCLSPEEFPELRSIVIETKNNYDANALREIITKDGFVFV